MVAPVKELNMAYWNGEKIVHWPSEDCGDWLIIDCGCCTGLQWGRQGPVECPTCKGGGVLYLHKKTGTLALYPGGPLCGSVGRKRK